MKIAVAMTFLLIVSSCGKKGGGENHIPKVDISQLQSIETPRIDDISMMTSEEVLKQADLPLITQEGTLKLLELISSKIENGSMVSDLSSHIWLLLESIHQNWLAEDKSSIQNKLQTLASQHEELEGMIGLFLQSEGLKSLDDKNLTKTATDPNYRRILERRNILIAKKLLTSAEGVTHWIPNIKENDSITKASHELIYQNLKTQSLGQPIGYTKLETSWELPFIEWSGSGSDGHAFITPNMSSQNHGDRIDYTLSLVTEIKGGTKK